MEEPKNPEGDNVFAIYSLLATPEQKETMGQKYRGGNFGYGHAKQELYELIVSKFKKERELYNYFMSNNEALEEKLEQGEAKARVVARQVLERVRKKVGYI
jgi:tryptophanyl-tRNA synthetase